MLVTVLAAYNQVPCCGWLAFGADKYVKPKLQTRKPGRGSRPNFEWKCTFSVPVAAHGIE
jgi:hypothetical protein